MRADKVIMSLLPGLSPLLVSGTVTDTVPDTRILKDVVVTSSEIIQTQDKMMVNVSKQIKRHSYDGFSMLSNLMLPGLDIDQFSSKVTAYGTDVLLAINGIKASINEVKTINPKDVIRIDYYTGYNPDFPTDQYVIDFIVKIRENGGTVTLMANQSLNRQAGNDLADWRMFEKKTEFGLRIGGSYDHYPSGYSRGETYLDFSDGNVLRIQKVKMLATHENNLKGTAYFLYRTNRGIFKTAFALEKIHDSNLEEFEEENEKNSVVNFQTADVKTHKDRTIPSFLASYDHKFDNNSSLSFSLNGDYANTAGIRDYLSAQNVLSSTAEDFYSLRPRAIFQMHVGKGHNLFTEAKLEFRHSKIDYAENSSSSISELTNMWTDFAIGDNYKINKSLSLFLMAQMRYGKTKTLVHDEKEFFITPTARLSWMLPKGNKIGIEFNMASSNPSLSMYSTEEKWVDPFTLRKGNPYLRSSLRYNASSTYTSSHKWGMFELKIRYNLTSDAIYLDIKPDETRQMYVQTFENGGNYGCLNVEPALRLNMISNKLSMRASLVFQRVDAHTYRHLHSDCLIPKVGFLFMEGGFWTQLNYISPHSAIDQYGEKYYTPLSLELAGGYDIDNWSFNLSCRNPFMNTRQRISISLPGIAFNSYNWHPRSYDNNLSLNVSYRFSYGKPKHKYQNVNIEQTENSAILDH